MFSISAKVKRYLTIGVISFFTLVIIGLVPYATITSLKAGDRKFEKQVTNGINPNAPGADFNGYLVYVNVTAISTVTMSSNIHFQMINSFDTAPLPNYAFQLLANSKSFQFASNDYNPQADATFVITTGSGNLYPFDSYTVEGSFILRNTAGNVSYPLAVQLSGTYEV